MKIARPTGNLMKIARPKVDETWWTLPCLKWNLMKIARPKIDETWWKLPGPKFDETWWKLPGQSWWNFVKHCPAQTWWKLPGQARDKFLGDAERFWQMVHQFCLKFSNFCVSALQFSSIHAHPRTLKFAQIHETCRKLNIDEKCRYPTSSDETRWKRQKP